MFFSCTYYLNEINVDFDLERVNLKTHKTEKGADYYEINRKAICTSFRN